MSQGIKDLDKRLNRSLEADLFFIQLSVMLCYGSVTVFICTHGHTDACLQVLQAIFSPVG